MKYRFLATIQYKEGIIDPEQKTILKVLKRSGYNIENLTFKKVFNFDIEAENEDSAIEIANKIVDEALANPVLEKYEFKILN